VGSTQVGGVAAPKLGDGCIVLCETGPNTVDDTPANPDGCQGDDELLGSGPTDGAGNFLITVPPLELGDLVCAVDTCSVPPVDGACQLVGGAAPAPTLSQRILALAIAVLGSLGLLGIYRRRRSE
jgi:hypothetical protein